MLDTNIFNAVLDGEYISDLQGNWGRLRATYIQEKEIEQCDEVRKEQLLKIFKKVVDTSTSTSRWGVTPWGRGDWSSDAGRLNIKINEELSKSDPRKRRANNQKDADIAETALKKSLVLVTHDSDLFKVFCKFEGKASNLFFMISEFQREQKPPSGYMLDTNIFNAIQNFESLSYFKSSRVKFFATPVQEDELKKTPDENLKNALLEIFKVAEKIPCSIGFYGRRKYGEIKYSSRETRKIYDETLKRLEELNKKKRKNNNENDSTIAVTAFLNDYALVTHDKELFLAFTERKGKSVNMNYLFPDLHLDSNLD